MWRDRGISLALVIIEALWLYAVLFMIGKLATLGKSPLSFLTTLLILGSAFLIGRWLNQVSASAASLRAAGVVLGVVVIFFALAIQLARGSAPFDIGWVLRLGGGSEGVRDAVLALMASIVLFWRGTRLSLGDDLAESLRRSFQMGVVVMALFAIGEALFIKSINSILILFPFFGVALGGLALANIKREEGDERHEFSIREWMRVTISTIAGILVFGALLGFLAGNRTEGFLSGVISIIGFVLDRIFYIVFLILGYIVQFFFNIFLMIRNWLGARTEPFQFNPANLDLLKDLQKENQNNQGLPGLIVALMKWGFFALVTSAVLLWLARAFLFRRSSRRVGPNEVRESVWEEGALQNDLAALLNQLWSNLGGRRPRILRWDINSQDEGIRLVYALYIRLIEMAQGKGVERQSWQTPLEFQTALVEHFPNSAVEQITQAFVKARYGMLGPTTQEVGELRSAWETIQTAQSSARS